jgi:hypothetical protein
VEFGEEPVAEAVDCADPEVVDLRAGDRVSGLTLSSVAARRVNVVTITASLGVPHTHRSYRTRQTSISVLPEPGPARI